MGKAEGCISRRGSGEKEGEKRLFTIEEPAPGRARAVKICLLLLRRTLALID